MVQVRLHSTGAASRLAALLNARILADILASRALRSGRIAGLGATTDFHHGLPETATLAASVDERETERKRRAAGEGRRMGVPGRIPDAVADAATGRRKMKEGPPRRRPPGYRPRSTSIVLIALTF